MHHLNVPLCDRNRHITAYFYHKMEHLNLVVQLTTTHSNQTVTNNDDRTFTTHRIFNCTRERLIVQFVNNSE